jgi:hypothetical protein
MVDMLYSCFSNKTEVAGSSDSYIIIYVRIDGRCLLTMAAVAKCLNVAHLYLDCC